MNVVKKLIKYNYSSRGNSNIKYIVIHDTGNKKVGSGANNHYIYFNGGDRGSSADYFVDDKEILQLVEDTNFSWQCGDGKGFYGITNANSIGIEICVNPDSNYKIAVEKTIELTKFLMKKYNIPVENVIRHYDASRKRCPRSMEDNNWAEWHLFKSKLIDTLKLYRIRKSWEDAKSQIGAYANLETAKKLADTKTDYNVYDEDGNLVYPERKVIMQLGYKRALRLGLKGEDVKDLQLALIELGYNPNGIDGSFGNGTSLAVKLLQKNCGLVVDGSAGQATINLINQLLNGTIKNPSPIQSTTPKKSEIIRPETLKKSKFYKNGNVSIIETTADNIGIKILGNTLVGGRVFGVNGSFYDTPRPTLTKSCWSIATNDGKAIGENSMLVSYTRTIKRGTIVCYKDGTVDVLRVNSINEYPKPHNWSISGYSVYPYIDFKAEQMPSGIDYKTSHTYIAYKGDKIYLMVKPNCMIKDILPLVKQMGLEGCLVLDGGGSSQLRHPNGNITSSRKINSVVILKEV